MNLDDLDDHRPGQRAATERGAAFPLVDAGFTKADVRAWSKELGLVTWDKPAAACLASRLPYGTPVTLGRLSSVEQAEAGLPGSGSRSCACATTARSPASRCPTSVLEEVVAQRDAVVAAVEAAGYRWVALDLAGLAQRRASTSCWLRVTDDPADAAALQAHARALLDAVDGGPAELGGARGGRSLPAVGRPARATRSCSTRRGRAGLEAAAGLEPALRELLTTDVDAQRTNPLPILRSAVRFPTAVLQAAGVPPVERDAQAERDVPRRPLRPQPGRLRRPRWLGPRARPRVGGRQGPRRDAPTALVVLLLSSRGSKRCQPASVIERGSKKRQSSGQANGATSAASTRQRCTMSPEGVVRVE